jgi:hypothetical protein
MNAGKAANPGRSRLSSRLLFPQKPAGKRAAGKIACLTLAWQAFGEVVFEDITAASKIDFLHAASPTPNKYLIETMGGGVALFDYDNDGRLDLFFVNGASLKDAKIDKSDRRFWNRLYHQKPDGTFEDVTERAGLTGARQGSYGMGVAAGDFDNDGFTDLYVTGYGANTLYRNQRDGTFADVTAKSGTKAGGWSSSAGFFDFDNDGKLDLFVGRYVDWSFEKNPYCGIIKQGARAYCHPDNFQGVPNILYRNNGDGTFTDVSARAGIANPNGKTLGVAFADYDQDGWIDIYVANDSVQCFLYRNKHDGTFEEVSLAAGAGFNEDGKTFAGMGTDFADYDNDGWPDIVVTDLSDERYVLFHNKGDGTFTDATTDSGLGRATHLFSGWSTRFLDYDNDGWKDLFVAQGHVMDTIALTSPSLSYQQPPLMMKNDGGKFTRAKPGAPFDVNWAGRAAAFGDIDNDGDIDIVVANVNQRAYLLRNHGGNGNGWIGVQNAAIGCRVQAITASGREQFYEVQTAAGYQSASDPRVIVGLGGEASARSVEIRCPGSKLRRYENVKSGQWIK